MGRRGGRRMYNDYYALLLHPTPYILYVHY